MNSLDLFSIRALMQALQQIHSIMDIFARPGSLFSAVRGLVPDSRLSIDQLDLKTGVVRSVSSEDRFFSKGMKRKIVELMPSHPVMPGCKSWCPGSDPGHRLYHAASIPTDAALCRNAAVDRYPWLTAALKLAKSAS